MKLQTDVNVGDLDYAFQMGRTKTPPKRFPYPPTTLEELWALVGFLQGEYERNLAAPPAEFELVVKRKEPEA